MQFDQLKRREFFKLLGSAVAVWPLMVRTQKPAGGTRQSPSIGERP
jgi:hypothetical protein